MCFVLLQAGLRRLPDAGPDLSARRLSDFSLDLSVSNPVSTISKQKYHCVLSICIALA